MAKVRERMPSQLVLVHLDRLVQKRDDFEGAAAAGVLLVRGRVVRAEDADGGKGVNLLGAAERARGSVCAINARNCRYLRGGACLGLRVNPRPEV